MSEIHWNNGLSVGIDLIDEQHKMLIQKLNDVSTAVEAHHGVEKIAKTLDFLVDYTNFHFSTEEKHMTASQYPGLDDHRTAHQELIATLADLERDFGEEGATQALAEAVNTFLWNWLVKHIKGVDVRFGAFLRDKGITLPSEA